MCLHESQIQNLRPRVNGNPNVREGSNLNRFGSVPCVRIGLPKVLQPPLLTMLQFCEDRTKADGETPLIRWSVIAIGRPGVNARIPEAAIPNHPFQFGIELHWGNASPHFVFVPVHAPAGDVSRSGLLQRTNN